MKWFLLLLLLLNQPSDMDKWINLQVKMWLNGNQEKQRNQVKRRSRRTKKKYNVMIALCKCFYLRSRHSSFFFLPLSWSTFRALFTRMPPPSFTHGIQVIDSLSPNICISRSLWCTFTLIYMCDLSFTLSTTASHTSTYTELSEWKRQLIYTKGETQATSYFISTYTLL